jgi:murein DD-endopeptidase MepM/ murein hydrolase activator NlpD
VLAALPGTVGFAGSVGGKPVVTVLHGGRRTTYEPVVATVERGQAVDAGDVLGRLIVTDSHCFPAACLHWGLVDGETYLDPLTLVGSAPVRLLPLWRDEPSTLRASWAPPLVRWERPVDWLP